MKFFNKRGAKVSVQLTFSHYHKSPLVQGGLEVGCEVTTGMPLTAKNIFWLSNIWCSVRTYTLNPRRKADKDTGNTDKDIRVKARREQKVQENKFLRQSSISFKYEYKES